MIGGGCSVVHDEACGADTGIGWREYERLPMIASTSMSCGVLFGLVECSAGCIWDDSQGQASDSHLVDSIRLVFHFASSLPARASVPPGLL